MIFQHKSHDSGHSRAGQRSALLLDDSVVRLLLADHQGGQWLRFGRQTFGGLLEDRIRRVLFDFLHHFDVLRVSFVLVGGRETENVSEMVTLDNVKLRLPTEDTQIKNH